MKRLAVFCGSSVGSNPVYIRAARELGLWLAAHGTELVYGGSSVGLMGVCADTVLEKGGRVTGVIPKILQRREVGHPQLTTLYVVNGMHERKEKMFDLADAFVALPGGTGTLDEIFEAITWSQLGLHHKPCAFYNVGGYYTPLSIFLDQMVDQQFLNAENREKIIIAGTLAEIEDKFATYTPPDIKKYRLR